MMPNPKECCFYKIQEGTKNEYVTIGSDGNILRWADTGGSEQIWLIVPVNATQCKIQTKQNGEFMAVGSNGNILRWADTGGSEQEFSFVNYANGWWNIQIGTGNEFVAVGSNGNILRWAKTGGNDQKFKLIPVHPMAKPQLQPGENEPGAIGDVPRITGFGMIPPERTNARLIAETLIPAVYVQQDPAYSDRVQQVARNPYYILRREQYWDRSGDRGGYYEHDGYREFTKSVTVQFGFSQTSAKSVEDTLGVKVSASGEFTYGGATAALSSEMSRELKVQTSQETQVTSERTETFEVKFPKDRFAYALWSMVDHYLLLNMQRKLVREWEIVLKGTSIADAYPRELPSTPLGS
jgi:hypothetical protein